VMRAVKAIVAHLDLAPASERKKIQFQGASRHDTKI
jgi:hypothetical protein